MKYFAMTNFGFIKAVFTEAQDCHDFCVKHNYVFQTYDPVKHSSRIEPQVGNKW